MFNKLKEYFSEGTKKSFTRLAAGTIIATGCLIALVECGFYLFDHEVEIHTALIGELIGFGLGGKVIQKRFEKTKADGNT